MTLYRPSILPPSPQHNQLAFFSLSAKSTPCTQRITAQPPACYTDDIIQYVYALDTVCPFLFLVLFDNILWPKFKNRIFKSRCAYPCLSKSFYSLFAVYIFLYVFVSCLKKRLILSRILEKGFRPFFIFFSLCFRPVQILLFFCIPNAFGVHYYCKEVSSKGI